MLITLAAFQNSALSGPAILPTAQPDFQAPLSIPRTPTADNPDTETGADGQPPINSNENSSTESNRTAGSGFTIIGGQGTSGLEEPEDSDLTRTVREELTGGSRDQGVRGAGEDAGLSAGESTGSTADIVRALVNSVPGQSSAGSTRNTGRQSNGDSLIASVIDSTVTDLVATLLNPKQATDDMVTFSIAGFGDFALLHLQENNSFFVVDLNGGTAIKFAQGNQTLASSGAVRQPIGTNPPKQVGGKSNGLQRVIAFLEDNVLPFMQSPITLAALGLFVIIWVIWRLSAQA